MGAQGRGGPQAASAFEIGVRSQEKMTPGGSWGPNL